MATSRHGAGRRDRRTWRSGWITVAVALSLAVSTGLGVLVYADSPAKPARVAGPVLSDPAPDPTATDEQLVQRFMRRTADRSAAVSRAGARPALERGSAEQAGDGRERRKQPDLHLARRWLTADLNLWSGPGEGNRLLRVLPAGTSVRHTGYRSGPWAQLAREHRMAWVRASFLVEEKPVPEVPDRAAGTTAGAAGGNTARDNAGGDNAGGGNTSAGDNPGASTVSGSPCPDGSTVESGLVANAVGVYRAVCAAFPAVGAWGGLRPGDDGYHGTGQALDVMVGTDATLGQAVADYARANASTLGVSEVIWAQHIWTAELGEQGWRPMEDRGSATANHYDHVHVSVY